LAAREAGPAEVAVLPQATAVPDDFMKAEVLAVGRLLDGRFRFQLACLQRAYAWRPENVTRLLSDLRWAMQRSGRKRRYALGRLMVAKAADSADAELVDGHQRLVTLTILFAVLRDLETDPQRAEALHRLIVDESKDQGDPRRYKLLIQKQTAPLFARAVQERGTTENDPGGQRERLSEAERNIVDNRECIRSELLSPGTTEEYRRELADFLLEKCFVITVIVDDSDDGWDILDTEQNTRLAFTHADEAKAAILSAMSAEEHVPAALLWERCESILTPEDMYRLLCHIRSISWRGRFQSSRPVEAEIVERFGIATDGLRFMSEQLMPYANCLKDIRQGNVGRPGVERDAVTQHIDFISWVDPHAWNPALLLWLKVHGLEGPDTLTFARRLDRLVWMSRIAGVDPGVQETRMLHLLGEIEAGVPVERMGRLQIESKLRAEVISNLRSPNLAAKHYAGYLLRRLSILYGSDPGPIVRDDVTIEHILPRNPHGVREWLAIYRSPDGCKAHHQKLGNVVLLSGPENQLAGTKCWEEKRAILARSSFSLARDASQEAEWTARTITRRTDQLVNMLLKSFGLAPLAKGE
jgi:hypothetical protein